MNQRENRLKRHALWAGLVAGSGLLAAAAFAMPGATPGASPGGKAGCEMRQGQAQQGKREAFRARHLAGLKEKLQLQPSQEAAWNAFVQAGQPGPRLAKADREARHEEFQKLSTPERLDHMLAMSDLRRAKMVERAAAVKAFYAQLTPEQQKVFDAEAMPARGAGKRLHHPHHRHAS